LCGGHNGGKQWKTGGHIVLTIHHINYNTKDNRLYNLLACCQRCHNKLDMPLRIDNRKKAIASRIERGIL
jgi:5-methylcytosine-specific restriction endonuclease McrA